MRHEWQYCSLGGVVRVKIGSGEDIAHLGELDEKMWTVLSCPTDGLEMDKRTLALIDSDHDGKIRVAEVVASAKWLCSVVKDKDLILRGDTSLPLDQIDISSPEGLKLYNAAKQIVDNLNLDKQEITLEHALDSAKIFAGTRFNGDGIITAGSTDDEQLKALIAECIATCGSVNDRSGEAGVDADKIAAFYAACADYLAWNEAGTAEVFPFGDKTAAAYAACNALKEKVADFYKRCALLRYDSDAAASVSISVAKIDEISACPLAKPVESGILPLEGLNPDWQAAFDTLMGLVGSQAYEDGISLAAWKSLCAKFDAFAAWSGAKKGAAVESLGLDRVKAVLTENRKEELLALVEKDKECAEEASSIDGLQKLMLLYRDFYKLLSNFVIFTDFYNRKDGNMSLFEMGKLYIDQRCCNLCIKVADMGKHADMAKLSGMFLIYCKCTSKLRAASMDIVAVMTDGSISELRPGKNGVFYDRAGLDWDAVITKIVDNPVSIRQAFWDPYRKFWNFCVGLINKSAADKEGKVTADLQKIATDASAKAPGAAPEAKSSFDIAKFAGIFAAIGLAIGAIGNFIKDVVAGVSSAEWWELVVGIVAILLVISGPSCFIAWSKLRKRNLGPVLNANGWAVNSRVLVNILFGAKLTSIAKYPKLNLADPYSTKTPAWKKWLIFAIFLIIIAFVVLVWTGVIDLGLDKIFPKK